MKKSNSSMQLTRAADYAVRVMVQLATSPAEQRVLLPDLAAATDAPESFLSKVLQELAKGGSSTQNVDTPAASLSPAAAAHPQCAR